MLSKFHGPSNSKLIEIVEYFNNTVLQMSCCVVVRS